MPPIRYHYNSRRLLLLEHKAGTELVVDGTVTAANADGDGDIVRTFVISHGDSVTNVFEPPLPSRLIVRFHLRGEPNQPFLLVTEIGQPTRKIQSDVASGLLDSRGSAVHELDMSAQAVTVTDRLIARGPTAFAESEVPALAVQEQMRSVIAEAADRYDVALTSYAVGMLSLPIMEEATDHPEIAGADGLRAAIDALMSEMATNPDGRDVARGPNRRSAVSVIRAYAAKFCRIAPFCGPGSEAL
jgi:hypothetical protein